MIIRLADKEKDFASILYGARDFISRMDYTEFLPDKEIDRMENIRSVIALPVVKILLAENDKLIVGGLGFSVVPNIWNQQSVVAEELFWWTDKRAPKTTALRLLREGFRFAKNCGASFISFKSLTSSPEKVGRVYEKMGLRPIETSYMGSL